MEGNDFAIHFQTPLDLEREREILPKFNKLWEKMIFQYIFKLLPMDLERERERERDFNKLWKKMIQLFVNHLFWGVELRFWEEGI